ncbi:MAG: F0F1 ATP synthase subunit B [Abditibacteriota bacterium]|nr:F0F1 ATP synthase subunit B [Abditibacteriota bacterium]
MKRVLFTALALTLTLGCCAFAAEEEAEPIWQQGAVFLLQAVGFVITVLLLKKWLFVPVSNLFAQREAEIEDNYLKSEAARDAAMSEKEKYEARMAQCDEEIYNKTAAAAREAQKQADNTVAKAREEADRRLRLAQDEIAMEKEKAMKEVRRVAVNMGMQVAEKVLRDKVTPEDNSRLVDDFIDRLDGEAK